MEKLIFGMNEHGQAAITDALFFLTIAASLSGFLFYFSTPYGTAIADQIALQYRSDYITSALKTILYSSTPRDSVAALNDPNLRFDDTSVEEIDYLMAVVKEDYADNSEFEDETKDILKNSIAAVMKPVSDAYDYLFYIYVEPSSSSAHASKFPFVMLYSSKWTTVRTHPPLEFEPEKDVIYYCEPDSLEVIDDKLLPNVGLTYQSTSKMRMPTVNQSTVNARVTLVMWVSSKLPPGILNQTDLNCISKEEIFP